MSKRRPALLLGVLLSVSLALGACTDAEPEPAATPSLEPTVEVEPVVLSLGVFGSEDELDAWSEVVRTFNDGGTGATAELVEWSSREAALRALDAGEVPDVFLASQRDLAFLLDQELTRPVSELLDERGVDFGDLFSRDAVAAFGVDDELQCMAYSVSPMVLYLNEELIDFQVMEERELDIPDRWDRWSLEEFTAAARFASRPARRTSGFHIEPTLEALTPFVVSGGGSMFDDSAAPSSLNLSDEDSRAALEETLAVLRDPTLTLSEGQLERRSPLEWFKRGRLGMIAGYRDLVPELRDVEGLEFDVMSMPIVEDPATVGEIAGLCMARGVEDPGAAADLIRHLVAAESMATVTEVGGIVPAHVSVAASDAFLQPQQMPARARAFNTAVRGIVVAPPISSWPDLEEAVAEEIQALLLKPGELDLEDVTTRIDEASRAVLDPEALEESAPDEEDLPEEE